MKITIVDKLTGKSKYPVEADSIDAIFLSPDESPVLSEFVSRNHRWINDAWVFSPELSEYKDDKRQKILTAWNIDNKSGVIIGNKTAPTTVDAWTRYLALKAMAEDADWVDVPIELTDGSFELITKQKAVALWAALKAKERALLAKLKSKIDQIQAATSVEEVDAITWDN